MSKKYTPDTLTASLFDGKVCRDCHQYYPLSFYGRCIENADRLKTFCKFCAAAVSVKYYHKHKEKAAKTHKEWAARNREKRKSYMEEWRKNNPHLVLEQFRKYRANNQKHLQETRKEWTEKNRQHVRDYNRGRKAARKAAGEKFTSIEWQQLCDQYDNICLCCKEAKTLTADHVIPISKGGTNHISNIQPLCSSCNSSKKQKTTDYRPAFWAAVGAIPDEPIEAVQI